MPYPKATHQPFKQAPFPQSETAQQLVVVFGALRSGTTLLRLMLNAHPDLNNPGEVDFLTDHIRRAPNAPTGWRYDMAALRSDRMFRAQNIVIPERLDGLDLLHALLERLAAKKRGLLCVSMHRDLALMTHLLPHARIVHLLRDPRDVARSSVEMGWSGTLYHAADHWQRSEQDWLRIRDQIDTKDRIELRFEMLMDAPEAELSRLCQFLGVPYSPLMLDYPSHSTYAPPNPLLARQWVQKCAQRDVAELESKIAPLMHEHGYTCVSHLAPPSRLRRLDLALRNKLGMWRYGVRNYGALPFFGARVAHKLRARKLERYFQKRIDDRIRQMLR